MVSVCPAFKPPSLLCIFNFNFACDFEIHDLMASILLNACLLFGNPLFFLHFLFCCIDITWHNIQMMWSIFGLSVMNDLLT